MKFHVGPMEQIDRWHSLCERAMLSVLLASLVLLGDVALGSSNDTPGSDWFDRELTEIR